MKQNCIKKVALIFITQVVLLLSPIIFTVNSTFADQVIADTGSIVATLLDT